MNIYIAQNRKNPPNGQKIHNYTLRRKFSAVLSNQNGTTAYTFCRRLFNTDYSFYSLNFKIVTFCVSRRRRKMYCGHAVDTRVCVSVCVSVRGRTPALLHGPGCNLGRGRGCPLVVHYWADLQSGHGLPCYGNVTRTLVTSLRPSHDMTTYANGRLGGVCARCWPLTGG